MKVDVYPNRAIMSLVFQLLRHIRGLMLARCMKPQKKTKQKLSLLISGLWSLKALK